ncbi:hypothetical protein KEN51_CDS0330 [Pseudomonas phage vB_Pae10145-KEN51]|nr:hypothetical protein [Pseudomonas phage ANB1]WNV50086.1 hypothetical protein [Pseudomonas phage PhiPizzaParty]WRQ05771.1 hypothetical protein IPCDMZAV_CDS0248 [Pseudomonas phage 6B]WRQ06268.1 hypothetical protein QAMIJHJT_CDS0337 [Pseudomonas phage 9-Ps-8B]WRQ06676.1 hypothetical protein FOPPYZMZ_CDS0336 [Pseudomonas phage 9Ps-7B]WRQ07027.1 hypothetical protein ZBUARNPM_CDS0278 [Pseudomonas phage 14Ps5-6]
MNVHLLVTKDSRLFTQGFLMAEQLRKLGS